MTRRRILVARCVVGSWEREGVKKKRAWHALARSRAPSPRIAFPLAPSPLCARLGDRKPSSRARTPPWNWPQTYLALNKGWLRIARDIHWAAWGPEGEGLHARAPMEGRRQRTPTPP